MRLPTFRFPVCSKPEIHVAGQKATSSCRHTGWGPWTAALLLLLAPGSALAGGIGNLVFKDQDGNRSFSPGDQRVVGVTLQLYTVGQVPGTETGQPFQQTVTDGSGRYFFSGVPDGDYFVFIPPTAFTGNGALVNTRSVGGTLGAANTDDNIGENGIDSAQPMVDGVRSGVIVLRSGQAPVSYETENGDDSDSDDAVDGDVDLTVDFGFEPFSTKIGDFVWLDTNRNGLQDPGEPGLPGVAVQLFDLNDGVVGQTQTASDGFYLFSGMPPGTYNVRFPTAVYPYVLTIAGQDPSSQRDSDAAVATGRTPDFTVVNLENQILRDAGYVVDRPDIGDYIFNDLNADGVQDAGEEGIGAVTVTLFAASNPDTPLRTTQSDPSGHYQFTDVDPGQYFLHFPPVAPGGQVLSEPFFSDPATDSNPDPGTGKTSVLNVSAGENDWTIDAGYHAPPASISGTAWHDLDKDGVRDQDEPVLAGVAVSLIDAFFLEAVDTTFTDASGAYRFSNLNAQDWLVEFSQLAGVDQRYQLTLKDIGGNDTLDSDPAPQNGRTPIVSPQNGEQFVFDAGYKNVRLGIGNTVFKDTNEDGLFTPGEGVEGVTVQLFHAGDNPGSVQPAATRTTSMAGTYYFFDLVPGQYFVRIPPSQFLPEGALAGAVSLPGDGADDGADDNAGENGNDVPYPGGSGVRSNIVTLTTGSEPRTQPGTESGWERTLDNPDDMHIDLTVDFGFTSGMVLGNLVYTDYDGSGGYTSGEGTPGVQVELYRAGDLPGADAALGSTVTDALGFYDFSGLEAGSYFAHVSASNFLPGHALGGARSLPGHGTPDPVDDGQDENGIDSNRPGLDGISSPAFTLVAGSAPTHADGENGAGSTADDARDTFGNLTVDFGFSPGLPVTYTDWQQQQQLPPGANSPSQDADGDGLPNGYEYLFNLPPSGGVALQQPLTLTADPLTGRLDARLVFNSQAWDIIPVLTCRRDLRDGLDSWQQLTAITPVATELPDGLTEYRWLDLESAPVLGSGTGFIRVSAGLDTNADTVPDINLHTPALGWREREHQAGLATAGIGFINPALFTGTVDGAAATSLTFTTAAAGGNLGSIFAVGIPCYAEITSGTYQGHRFEIDEIATSGAVLRLQASSSLNTLTDIPDLTGARVAVRRHFTLEGLFPPAQFHATTDPATSDQILTYPRPSFATHWLLDLGGGARWVRSDDINLSDAGGRAVPPGEGLFVDRRISALTVLDLGEVRPHRMARVLTAGYTLQASGWPVPGSPESWHLLQIDGFTGSTNPALADGLQTWRADRDGGQKAFRSFFLLHAGAPYRYWADKSDASLQNQDEEEIFGPGRAAFLQLRSTVEDSFEPSPWTP